MADIEPWVKEIVEAFAGVALFRRKYALHSESWDHDHCEICGQKLMDRTNPES